MQRNLVTFPHPALEKRAQSVRKVNKQIVTLLNDMAEIMYAEQGIGLAAPQVGMLRRAIVVDVQDGSGLLQLVNPKIKSREGQTSMIEGCLSFPGLQVEVQRAEKVLVAALNLKGKKVTVEAEGLLAICLQHEIDHLDGRTLIRHVMEGTGKFPTPSEPTEQS